MERNPAGASTVPFHRGEFQMRVFNGFLSLLVIYLDIHYCSSNVEGV